jgi:hypothetical protein
MARRNYQTGDWVIYRKSKQSPLPGPRAQQVNPSPRGEVYSYVVDKFWIVTEVLPGNRLKLRTRRGKEHELPADDPNLRPVRFWERWLYHQRFEDVARAIEKPSEEFILSPEE